MQDLLCWALMQMISATLRALLVLLGEYLGRAADIND